MSIESWWHDLRYGLRTLKKNPGFCAVAVTALALGIGANATVFSLANAILFKDLPFEDSENVFYVTSANPRSASGSSGISVPDYKDFSEQVKSFESLGASTLGRGNLSDDRNAPESYNSARITANGFGAVGQSPLLGRTFQAEDERAGADPVAILTWALWDKRYGRDPSLVGRKIRVDSVPTTVIGVMDKDFSFPPEAEFWLPLIVTGNEKRQDRYLSVFGKLAKGATLAGAQAEVAALAQRLASQYPDTNKEIRGLVQTFHQTTLRGEIRTVFTVLLGAVGFVLLIACANVANLMLARAVGRAREISIRAALGAGRWRVVRQLLIESMLVSTAGGLVGWLIAIWGIRAFDAAVIPTGKPAWIDFSMDYRAFVYLAAITLGTGILFGLVPALQSVRTDVNSALKDGGRGASTGSRGKHLSGALVVAEMALAVVLLAGAGLMIRSFLRAYSMPAGADTSNVITMRLELPQSKYKPDQAAAFQKDLIQRLRALPGVETAAISSSMPGTSRMTMPYESEGAVADVKRRPTADVFVSSEGYFEILRVSPRRGRGFVPADHQGGPDVALINQAFADSTWPGADPIGKRFRFHMANGPMQWTTVLGVVPDIMPNALRPRTGPAAYVPLRQSLLMSITVLARTRVKPASLGRAFRAEVSAVDPDLPVREISTLDEQVALNRWPLRVFGGMFAIFAGVALLLATVGLYAVVAYGVNQRTHEIGVRVALGASGGHILRMVLLQGTRQTVIGLILGLGAAFGITRVMKTLLAGISPTDPLTFSVVALVLVAAAFAGCIVPARRAMRVDPAVALRQD